MWVCTSGRPLQVTARKSGDLAMSPQLRPTHNTPASLRSAHPSSVTEKSGSMGTCAVTNTVHRTFRPSHYILSPVVVAATDEIAKDDAVLGILIAQMQTLRAHTQHPLGHRMRLRTVYQRQLHPPPTARTATSVAHAE